jgi:hypothetical protein
MQTVGESNIKTKKGIEWEKKKRRWGRKQDISNYEN